MGWWFDLAGPQDITYGLSWDNVALRLTRLNWKTKAIFRANVYLWIARAQLHEKSKNQRTSYFVYFYNGEDEKMKKLMIKKNSLKTFLKIIFQHQFLHYE